MSEMENEPLGRRGSPFAVGVLSLASAALAAVIYRMGGTWPAERGGLGAALFVVLGILLIGYAWQTG